VLWPTRQLRAVCTMLTTARNNLLMRFSTESLT
jgi:hypothetical protein